MTLSHVVLIASGMVLMFLLESLFWPKRGLAWNWAAHHRQVEKAAVPSKAPPWGRVEYTRIELERPEEYFKIGATGAAKTFWIFRNHTEQQLEALFQSFDFSPPVLSQITNRANWEMLPRAIRVLPPPEAVTGLVPETRKKLYGLLAQNPENVMQAAPFRFSADGFDGHFANCGLPKDKIDLVRKLTYADGSYLCFADAPAFSQLSTTAETKALVKCLWRVSTLVMKIDVDRTTDVDALLKYWGSFGAEKAYRPLIESMARVQSGSSVNVSYFLPPFARLRLYTYPDPRDTNIVHEDCFWSAMNFFNTVPDPDFFNSDHTQKILASEYVRVTVGARHFGDLLMLVGRDERALHMCVYLADDVVFTKNGMNILQPWVLMRIPEMLGEYENQKPFQIIAYRRKTTPSLGYATQVSSSGPSL